MCPRKQKNMALYEPHGETMIEVGDLVKVKNKYLEASHESKYCWLVVETKVTYKIDVALCIQGSRKEWISFGVLEKAQ